MERMNRNTMSGVLIAAVLASAGSALAQSGGSGSSGEFDKPLAGQATRAKSAQPGQASRVYMKQSDGQDSYEIQIAGGQVTAKVNGKALPKRQIRQSDGKVELLNEDGDVLSTFDVAVLGQGGPGVIPSPQLGRSGGGIWTPQPSAVPWAEAEQPKVMLGINMGEPSESLLEQLDIEPGEAVVVLKTIEGLPAADAGIRENDVIIAVDGERPVDLKVIRDALKDKEPGDTIELTIVRKGESKKIDVELAAFDAERLGSMPMLGTMWRTMPQGNAAEAERMMREHMREQFKAGGHEMPPMVFGPGGEGGVQFYMPQSAEMQAKVEQLESRIKELNKQMERLSQQIERLQKQLDQ